MKGKFKYGFSLALSKKLVFFDFKKKRYFETLNKSINDRK